jgi:branched-subunit amino acid aminotransferase/4-amino-4-deoxychorismate lyase
MRKKIVLNGALIEAETAGISPLGEGFLYGRGIFETVKLAAGKPVFFAEHTERLRRSAGELALDWSVSDEELGSRCRVVAEANAIADGVLKIVVFQDEKGVGELLLTRENPYPLGRHAQGFKLNAVLDAGRSGKTHRLKTLNQLSNVMARAKARADGWDEALFHDSNGGLLEGTATNLFVVSRGVTRATGLHAPILPGIARAVVLRLRLGGRIEEATVTLAQALEADEVFVTNSLVGVMPVSRIDGRDYDLSQNPVTQSVMSAFRLAEAESIDRFCRTAFGKRRSFSSE